MVAVLALPNGRTRRVAKDAETPYLSLLPSEYFKRQGWITIEADEPNLQSLIASIGIDRLLWASDYPAPDATFPGVVEKFMELDLNEQQKRAIAQDNPIVLYGAQGTSSVDEQELSGSQVHGLQVVAEALRGAIW